MTILEPEWVSSDEQCHAVFSQLSAYIKSMEETPATGAQHTKDCTDLIRVRSDTIATLEEYRAASRTFWAIVLTMAKQVDASSTQHDSLATLALAIREIPLPQKVLQASPGADNKLCLSNETLRTLYIVSNRIEIDAPLHPPMHERSDSLFQRYAARTEAWRCEPGQHLTSTEWTNINAFLALVYSKAPDLLNFDLRGLWTMLEALETPLSDKELEDVLPAATTWIVLGGDALKHSTFWYPPYTDSDGPEKRLPWSRGQLWTGPAAFSESRWQFWMTRFKDIAADENVGDVVRQSARQAIEAAACIQDRRVE